MSTRYRTTYHGILLGLLLHVIMAQAVNAQRSLSERLDYFRSLGERTELELEEIRTPIVSYQALMDSITQRILTEQCSYIVYPAELGNAFTFVINPDANQAILRLGYLQSPSSLLPDHVEQCAYTPWLFGNELLTASKNKANADPLFRFFDAMPGPVKVTQALWYYFNKREPERILPPPTVENMYFFKGKTGDLDNMQSLLNSDKQGYIICPVWTEDVTGVLDTCDDIFGAMSAWIIRTRIPPSEEAERLSFSSKKLPFPSPSTSRLGKKTPLDTGKPISSHSFTTPLTRKP